MKLALRAGAAYQNHKAAVLTAAGVSGVLGGVLAMVGIAGATAYDPTTDLTTFGTSIGTEVGPIAVALVTSLLGVVILFWGIRFALSFIGGRRHS